MFVRLALESDVDSVCDMAKANAEETRAGPGFSEERVRAVFDAYLLRANPIVFVAEDARRLVGLLVMSVNLYDFADGVYTAQKVLYVRPENRGTRASVLLTKTLISESQRLGAKEIVGGNDNGFRSERTAKFLEHFGFERVGYAMTRRL